MKSTIMTGLFAMSFLTTVAQTQTSFGEKPGSETALAEAKIVKVSKVVRFTDDETKVVFRKEVHLGEFPPGTIVHSNITLENMSDRTLDFNHHEKGCKCLSLSPTVSKLGPGEKTEIRAVIETPLRSSKSTHQATFSAMQNSATQFTLRMTYVASGVVGFPGPLIRIKIPEGTESQSVTLPFFADKLSTERLIDLESSSNLAEAKFKMDYSKRTISATIPASILDHGRLSGELRISNIETNSTDRIVIDIDRDAAISVHPSVIRFSAVESNEGSTFTGSIVVHDKQAGADDQLHASFSINGKALTAKKKRAAKGVGFYSVILKSESEISAAMAKDAKVTCSVVGAKGKSIHAIPVLITDESQLPPFGDQ